MADISSEVRSFEKEQSPQCGAATIENADSAAEIPIDHLRLQVISWTPGSEANVSPVGCPTQSEVSRTSQPKGRAKPASKALNDL